MSVQSSLMVWASQSTAEQRAAREQRQHAALTRRKEMAEQLGLEWPRRGSALRAAGTPCGKRIKNNQSETRRQSKGDG